MADYREFQEKYGNKVNKALTDQAYIDWLIKVLQSEGFGTAKQVILQDGFKSAAVKLSEDEDEIIYKTDFLEVNEPAVAITIDQGSSFEWGQSIAAAALTVDFTVTRKTYRLVSLTFTGLDETDKDEADIDAAGVNNNLTVDYDWVFSDIDTTGTLVNGDTSIGTITAIDDAGQIVIASVAITRSNRWVWGLTNTPQSSADIAVAIGTKTGDIVPSDGDGDFYELTTNINSFPASIDVDTFGQERTLFIATINGEGFNLESTIPFEIPTASQTIDMSNLSGGNANVSRSYNVQTIDVNTFVTLIKQ